MAASVRIRFSSMEVEASTSCIFPSSLARYSATVWGLLASTCSTRPRIVSPRAKHVCGQRRALGRAHGIKLLQRRGDRIRQRGGPGLLVLVGFSTRKTSGSRESTDTEISSRTPYSETMAPMAVRYPSTTGRFRDNGHVAAGMVDGQIDVHLAPAHLALTHCLMRSSA